MVGAAVAEQHHCGAADKGFGAGAGKPAGGTADGRHARRPGRE